ncbi:MAG TPA: PEP-CTERM sorting domain-containing protein [Longimicrobiaceae bacterium]|jgi:hypothetical protein|nr:PEP-CTERM sorting domain-containing protein [Longimicrobiaceae bacterium]
MRHSWLLALAALLALPARGSGQQYAINPWAGITVENFRNFESGMHGGFGARFENGVMVERGGFGETFTIDVGSTLLSWALYHERCQQYSASSPQPATGECVFRAYVAGFDAGSGRATDVLWESPVYSRDFGPGPWPFTPGLWLDPGKYVAFVLWEGTPPVPMYTGHALQQYSYLAVLRSQAPDQAPASPGMELVELASRDPALGPGETVWTVFPAMDAQNFTATLDTTVTPEPATMALLGTGLAALAGAARRRRRREAAVE